MTDMHPGTRISRVTAIPMAIAVAFQGRQLTFSITLVSVETQGGAVGHGITAITDEKPVSAASQRAAAFPDVPTVAEAGFAPLELTTWYAVWGPRGLSPALAARMAEALRTAQDDER